MRTSTLLCVVALVSSCKRREPGREVPAKDTAAVTDAAPSPSWYVTGHVAELPSDTAAIKIVLACSDGKTTLSLDVSGAGTISGKSETVGVTVDGASFDESAYFVNSEADLSDAVRDAVVSGKRAKIRIHGTEFRGGFQLRNVRSVADSISASCVDTRAPWYIDDRTSEMDDSRSVQLHTDSTNTFTGFLGDQVSARLYLMCQEGRTGVLIRTGPLDIRDVNGRGRGMATVRVRYDNDTATQLTITATSNDGVYELPGPQAEIQKMSKSERIRIEITPLNQTSHVVDFDLRMLPMALDKLRSACRW